MASHDPGPRWISTWRPCEMEMSAVVKKSLVSSGTPNSFRHRSSSSCIVIDRKEDVANERTKKGQRARAGADRGKRWARQVCFWPQANELALAKRDEDE